MSQQIEAETARDYAKDLVIVMMSVSGRFNGYHEIEHNSAITRQN